MTDGAMNHGRMGEGQTALVTGASSGIGLELARCFARDGYNLAIVSRSAEALDAAAKSLTGETGAKVVPVAHDLSQQGAGTRLAETLSGRGIGIENPATGARLRDAGCEPQRLPIPRHCSRTARAWNSLRFLHRLQPCI